MALAALLGQLGRRVVVLELYSGLYNLPRAACFDDEIMRTFQKLGLVDEISRGAEIQPGYEWINGSGQILVDFQYDNPAPAGWAALYMMFQPHIEAVLDRHDKSLPTVDIRQGVTVSEIEQNGDAVILRGVSANGEPVSVRHAMPSAPTGATVSHAGRSVSTSTITVSKRTGWFATSVCEARSCRLGFGRSAIRCSR
jgi:2-polyprenyl-6-methoxyphenol hydroxylase-like FAD-dependent oxidoreductase